MAHISAEPSRSYRSNGFLHCSHRELSPALLLFRDQSRPTTNSARQCRAPSHEHLGDSATAGGISISVGSKFLIFDRDSKFSCEVAAAVRSLNVRPIRTSIESPWQNGVAERWVESCRRDLCDHVIAVNEAHLKRLLTEYVHYYQKDRTHLGLGKQTPGNRRRSLGQGHVITFPRLGGLHHRYERAA